MPSYVTILNDLRASRFKHVDEMRPIQLVDSRMIRTSEGIGYRSREGNVEVAITRIDYNPILKEIEAAARQLLTGFFRPSQDISDAAFNAPDTLVVSLSELRYQRWSHEKWVSLYRSTSDNTVNTGTKYEEMNSAEALICLRTGLTDEFLANLLSLGTKTTGIHFLSPEYVQRAIDQDSEGKPVWQVPNMTTFRHKRFNTFDFSFGE